MKKVVAIGMITLAAGCASQKTTYNDNYSSTSEVSDDVYYETGIVGLWEISIQTRRGTRNSELSIFEENGTYKGKTDRAVFDIVKNGNVLTWTSDVDSPRGKIKAQHRMTIDGNSMKGTVNASGRSLNASGRKK